MEVKKLDLNQHLSQFKSFVCELKNDTENIHFRYFNSRDLNVVLNHTVSLIIEDNDKIVGYAHVEFEEKYWFGIYINPKFRGKGYGSILWSRIKSYCISNNVEAIHLTVDNDNMTAINMYKSIGFGVIHIKELYTEFRCEFT